MPALKLYPPVPIPTSEYPLELKKAINQSVRYVKNYVQLVNSENYLGFSKVDPTIPKVLYFSDNEKESVPLMMKALSVSFNKKLSFGIVPKGQRDVSDHFSVKKYPSLLVVQAQHNKPSVYSG